MNENVSERAAEGQRRECRGCGKEVVSYGRGRPRLFCDKCRRFGVLDQTPEGIEMRRVYQRDYYARRKAEPEFMYKKRASQRAWYLKRKNAQGVKP
jgi:hypothetical protein